MSLSRASLIIFIASFCTLVIEILAGRMLAPHLGVSLYTWTSIIGVVLAGIGIGGYIGGLAADRLRHRKILGCILALSGIGALFIPVLLSFAVSIPHPMSLMTRIVMVTAIVYFIPSCLLGMITPIVVKQTVTDVAKSGRVVGIIYAVATAGSLTGVFLAGFVFISWLGTRMTILLIGVTLICTALFIASLFRSRRASVVFVVVLSLVLWHSHEYLLAHSLRDDVSFFKETDYFTIKIVEVPASEGGRSFKALILDNLLHSYVSIEDPLYIEYGYGRVYREVLAWRFRPDKHFRTLTIGGGGYTGPRYIETVYPLAEIDVVEIDPKVLEVAHDHLGLPRDTRVRSFIMDGRLFVARSEAAYDFIFLDVFNDLSLPYHLTTREFAVEMRRIMNSQGMLLTNIVDDFRKGVFLPSYIRTLQDVFGEGQVHLVAVHHNLDLIGISQFVVIAAKDRMPIADFKSFLEQNMPGDHTSNVVPAEMVQQLSRRADAVLLRDDHAPVDNLIAPVFEERFGYRGR